MTDNSAAIRYIQVFIFVANYIGIGFILKTDANTYLLIGIPLTLIFQIFIRRQPVYTLWVRDASKFGLSKWGVMLAVAFMVYPAKKLIALVLQHQFNAHTFWLMAACIGAVGAAFSFSHFTKSTLRPFFLCLATAGSIGVLGFVLTAIVQTIDYHKPFHFDIISGVKSMLLYIPVCFVIEEVVFRGLLDAHLHQPSQTKGIGSAIFVSALWGLWHLPVQGHLPADAGALIVTAVRLLVFHTIIGIPLSIFWRKSGNLAVPAFTHSLADAVREALLRHG